MKLGITVGYQTVKRILERTQLDPKQDKELRRKPVIPWSQFVQMHMETMLGCDFFVKKIWTWRGPMDAFVFLALHLGSRRVYMSPPTYNPDNIWLEQQVRNIAIWCEEEGIEPKYIIRDNNGKFNGSFDSALENIGLTSIRIPFRSPRANAFVESHIGALKRECLDHFICFSIKQLDRIITAYRNFYNQVRPHQGQDIGNRVLNKNFRPQAIGKVKCQSSLAGLLNHYYRDTA